MAYLRSDAANLLQKNTAIGLPEERLHPITKVPRHLTTQDCRALITGDHRDLVTDEPCNLLKCRMISCCYKIKLQSYRTQRSSKKKNCNSITVEF